MKTNLVAALAAVLAGGLAAGEAQSHDWKVDPAHSEADFAIKHMAISTVHGSFRGVTGAVHFDPADLSKSGVDATIDVNTVSTGVDGRDKHLRSPDFFDVAKYPTMTFKSTGVVKNGDHFDVKGDLTLHGVTKPVILQLETPGNAQVGMDKKPHRGFTATTNINRKDFGLNWGGKLTSGDAVLGDDIKIELNVETVEQP